MFTNADDVLKFIGDNKVQFVDVRFCDLPGTVQHFTVPVQSFGAKVFTEGLMFDGSSIRGFQQIHESDMLPLPDPATTVLDPFHALATPGPATNPATPADAAADPASAAFPAWQPSRASGRAGPGPGKARPRSGARRASLTQPPASR